MVKTYTEPYRGEASCGPVAHAAVAMGENARFDALLEYLETHETELRNLNLADLKQCLRTGVKSKTRAGDPQRSQHYYFLVREGHSLSAQQQEMLSQVATRICCVEVDVEAQFAKFMTFLDSRREELNALEPTSLLSFSCRHKAKIDKELQSGQNFLSTVRSKLSDEQEAEIERYEIEYCKPDTEPGRLKQEVAKQRQFDKFKRVLNAWEQELAAAGPPSLLSFCSQQNRNSDKDLRFVYDFLRSVRAKLSEEQEEEIEMYEIQCSQ